MDVAPEPLRSTTIVLLVWPQGVEEPLGSEVVDRIEPLVGPLAIVVVEGGRRCSFRTHGGHTVRAGMDGIQDG
jgi:hypothetical protein